MVESMVKAALIRLNPEIAEEPNRADEVIYKLRSLILSAQPHIKKRMERIRAEIREEMLECLEMNCRGGE